LIVHLDVPARVHCDTGLFQPQVVRIRAAPHSQQYVRPNHLGRARRAIHPRRDFLTSLGEGDALGVQANCDAFVLQNFPDGGGYIFVLPLHQARPHLDDRNLAAKPAEHLTELEADVAAAHHDQVPRQKVHLHH
jgi:hypothetical protein